MTFELPVGVRLASCFLHRAPLSLCALACTMFTSTEVNVTGGDQGLVEIFKKTEVQAPLALYFQESCGIKNSSDFLKYVSAAPYETELADIVKGGV